MPTSRFLPNFDILQGLHFRFRSQLRFPLGVAIVLLLAGPAWELCLLPPSVGSDRVDCCEQLQSRLGNGETVCSTTHHDSQFVLTNPYFDQDRITISDRKS